MARAARTSSSIEDVGAPTQSIAAEAEAASRSPQNQSVVLEG
ncbi:hypothetical protein SynRS9909_02233 [Synechococcus sp. RS9909]|nr:hypothetical protein SynRS9909_02233 [Synechococcus sp. RS9909]